MYATGSIEFQYIRERPRIIVEPTWIEPDLSKSLHLLHSPFHSAAASTPPPISIPSNMAKPKPRRQCDYGICKGKTVASSTWYLHNPGGSRIRHVLPQESVDVILRQPDTNILSRSQKRRHEDLEDVEAPISKRTTGSRDGTHLSPPSLEIAVAPVNLSGQEPRPPSPTIIHLDEMATPSPPHDFGMNSLDGFDRESRTNEGEPRTDGGGSRVDGKETRTDGGGPRAHGEESRADREGPRVDEERPRVDEGRPQVDEGRPQVDEGGRRVNEDLESTKDDLESMEDDLESTKGDLEPMKDDLTSSR